MNFKEDLRLRFEGLQIRNNNTHKVPFNSLWSLTWIKRDPTSMILQTTKRNFYQNFSIAFTLSKHTLSPKSNVGNVRWVFICFCVVFYFFLAPMPYLLSILPKAFPSFFFLHKQSSNFFLDIHTQQPRNILIRPTKKILKFSSFFFSYFVVCVFPMQNNNKT